MNTPRDLAIPFERVTWRDGQTLASRDLRDDASYVERLRHLHIRYQHRIWGVVEGLDVFASGSAWVIVMPGYALDIEGSELLLPAKTKLATPGIVARTTMYLVISAGVMPSNCAATPDLATLCPGVRDPLPLETGRLSWKTVDEVRPGIDLLLARAQITNGRLSSAIDTSIQRPAAAMDRLLTWSDTTLPGQTGWIDEPRSTVTQISAIVDTSDAGFIATPAYFARIVGPTRATSGFIRSVTASGFSYVARLTRLVAAEVASKVNNAAMAEQAGWTISWLALELPKGPTL
jgi:hypothetical protein